MKNDLHNLILTELMQEQLVLERSLALGYHKDDKPDFLAKYSSNQNEPKNKNIDNKIIDIFAVNYDAPEPSDEDLEDEM